MPRSLVAAACGLLCLALPPASATTTPAGSTGAGGALTYSAPVAPLTVTRPFQPPPGPYAAGHRGVDLATTAGQPVLAAGAGRVRFAGPVAGRGVVVIEHPDGVSTEYEPVTPSVAAGGQVIRGQVIGRVRGRHGSCEAGGCLHWGARRDGSYFDPMSLLSRLGPVRLLPWAAGAKYFVAPAAVNAAQARGCARAYVWRSRSTEMCV
jgi:murein DD-endopeptidase MepM/ murein hydrolase activator NlpD